MVGVNSISQFAKRRAERAVVFTLVILRVRTVVTFVRCDERSVAVFDYFNVRTVATFVRCAGTIFATDVGKSSFRRAFTVARTVARAMA